MNRTVPSETFGGVLSAVDMVVQQRDGLRLLCDYDDDDVNSAVNTAALQYCILCILVLRIA